MNILGSRTWRWFSSVKLTLFLFGLLAIGACCGTILPQGIDEARAVEIYGPLLGQVLRISGFLDVYHSWWFLSLFVLLSINLIVCSIDRLPATIRLVKLKERDLSEAHIKNLPIKESFQVDGPADEVMERVLSSFKEDFRGVICHKKKGEGINLYWEKGRVSRFGPYIIHGSVIFILIGALIGFAWGFRGYMQLAEGETDNLVRLQGGRGTRALDFYVRCDRFTVSFYKDGTPKDYRSDVSILENGRPVVQKAIRVNHPLRYKGISLYQSDYGLTGIEFMEIGVRKRNSSSVRTLRVNVGDKVTIGDDGKRFEVLRYVQDLQNFGPAVLISLSGDDRDREVFWILKRYPKFDESHRKGEEVFELLEVKEKYWTGLQITHDPGQWLVWVGCSIMILGLIVSFCVSHKRVWLLMKGGDGVTEVLVVGTSTKNRPKLMNRIRKWAGRISSGRSGNG